MFGEKTLASCKMQSLITQTQNIKKGTTKKKKTKILSYFAYEVNLDYGNFINVAIVSPETKKKQNAANVIYSLMYASQIKDQVDQAHSLSFTRSCPLLLARRHTLGIFWPRLKLICARKLHSKTTLKHQVVE